MLLGKLKNFDLTPEENQEVSAEIIRLMTDELHYTTEDDISTVQVQEGTHY
jgi:hypothetical protein